MRPFRAFGILALLAVAACLGFAPQGLAQDEPVESPTLDGVIFLPERGVLYVAAPDLQKAFGEAGVPEPAGKAEGEGVRRMPDGTRALRLRDLGRGEFQVGWDAERAAAWVEREGRRVWVRSGYLTVMEGFTLAGRSATLRAPLRGLAEALGTRLEREAGSKRVLLGEEEVPEEALYPLLDGTQTVEVSALESRGGEIRWQAEAARVLWEGRAVWVTRGAKRVEVNLTTQRMRAWQGDLLVLETPISSGRKGMETPTGTFRAGPIKSRMLISRKYGDAEMPWSVQVRGNVVIHGFPSVPPRAASHGCVRVPLSGGNPARWFYRWVDVGTPISIGRDWPSRSGAQ